LGHFPKISFLRISENDDLSARFGHYLHILKAVLHRVIVLSIPEIIRRCFLYGRKLLSTLSRFRSQSGDIGYLCAPDISAKKARTFENVPRLSHLLSSSNRMRYRHKGFARQV